jgi:lipopolysaccharide/colanic/teichoic acid biosynthesis glycosyltransferase
MTLHRVQVVVKRLFDIGAAVMGLIIAGPLWFVFVVLIRVDSKGPILFRQLRSGKNGRPFQMLKFRTMYERVPHLRNADGSAFVGRDDPRITRTGKFMREFSLDELPQLVNVLRGDMSLIGPRPEKTDYTAELPQWALAKLQVQPGCLNLPLIYGRNELSWEERNRLDVFYVENYTFALDLKILLLGAWSMLVTRRGVYSPGERTSQLLSAVAVASEEEHRALAPVTELASSDHP